MATKPFYVDDVPLAQSMDEFPPETAGKKPRAHRSHDPRYDTAPIITKMRKSRGVTQVELSRLVGRSRAYIGTLETRAGSCCYDTLAMIARVLGYKIIFVKDEKWREYEQAYNSWKINKRP